MTSSNTEEKKIRHEARPHAPCSASSAHRWLNCPGSVGLSVGIKQPQSSYADEGTLAHEIAEKFLTVWWKDKQMPTITDDSEMTRHVISYINFVKEISDKFDEFPNIRIEAKLTLNQEMSMYGTADIAMTGKINNKSCGKIIDLKYGKTPVQVKENPQLAYYAVALMLTSKQLLEEIEVIIFQPRIDNHIKRITYTREELLCWHGVLYRGAEKALWQVIFEKNREYKEGEWCKWCLAKKICPEFNKATLEEEALEFIDS